MQDRVPTHCMSIAVQILDILLSSCDGRMMQHRACVLSAQHLMWAVCSNASALSDDMGDVVV